MKLFIIIFFTVIFMQCTTSLHSLIDRGDKIGLEKQLKNGANINVIRKGIGSETLLMHASRLGNCEIIKLLLEKGVNINERAYVENDSGPSPLWYALFGSGKIINGEWERGCSKYGINGGIPCLLENGANPNLEWNNMSPLEYILPYTYTCDMDVKILIELLKHGADPNRVSKSGTSLIFHTIVFDQLNILEILLSSGADANTTSNSSLILQLKRKNKNKLIYSKNTDGSLDTSSTNLNSNRKALIPAKCGNKFIDYNSESGFGVLFLQKGFPLYEELLGDFLDFKLTKTAICKTLNLNVEGEVKTSAMHFATYKNQFNIVKMLIKYGAEPDITDIQGMTPLMISVLLGYTDLVKLLIESGADCARKNLYGYSAIDYAKFNDNNNILNLLQDK